MFDFENVPAEVREWVDTHLVPDLKKLEGYVTEHAPGVEAVLNSVVGALKLLAPGAGDEVAALVAAGEKGLAEVEALYEKYFGPKD
jgi:hypothetical protein